MHEGLKILFVALGGSLGAVSRYLVGLGLNPKVGDGFAWGTLAVNVFGCFVMGLLVGAGLNSNHKSFVLFGIGFLGSFTTFSAFSAESIGHATEGRYSIVALHLFGHVALSLAAAWLGVMVARSLGLAGQPE